MSEPYLSHEKSQHVTGDGASPVTAKTGEERRGEDSRGEDSTSSIYSVTSVTGGEPPAGSPSVAQLEEAQKTEIWRTGRAIFAEAEISKEVAGSVLGKLCKDYTPSIVLEAIRIAATEQVADPRSFLKATCQRLKGERKSAPKPTVYDQGMANAEAAKALIFGEPSHAG